MFLVKNVKKDQPKRRINENRMLVTLGTYCVEELKIAVGKTELNHKEDIIRSIKWKMLPGRVVVYSDHPAFYLDQGVRPHQMRYVKNKVVPFDPRDLKKATTEERRKGVAFRKMGEMGPKHPGSPPLNLVENSVRKAQDRLAVEMLSEYLMSS